MTGSSVASSQCNRCLTSQIYGTLDIFWPHDLCVLNTQTPLGALLTIGADSRLDGVHDDFIGEVANGVNILLVR